VSYQFEPHTADLKVTFETTSFADLIADGLLLLRELLAGSSEIEPKEVRALELTAADRAEVFHSFLRELLYLHATEGFLPFRFAPELLTDTVLRGRLSGERVDPARHAPQPEVKAVTRHGYAVRRTAAGWHATVIFDV
jgi:SHS2 domain-containing protein